MTSIQTGFIIPIYSKEEIQNSSTIEIAGGKGANLVKLARAGLPVPDGFLITTEGYQAFVEANRLAGQIQAELTEAVADDLESLEEISVRIRSRFASGDMPANLKSEITAAYRSSGKRAVAVRSSATAEDLPEMSFAGQQDTFLNVIGEEQLLVAVINCWSSLWTARAIGYRLRNEVPHSLAALAVVVQAMVESQASGVVFTANPLTGLRTEVVIDATLGLGEALVSGQVEPDHYVVDAAAKQIVSKTLGAKGLSIRGMPEGGTEAVIQDRKDLQALPDKQILSLAELCQQAAGLYHAPQDIEWAWADHELFLLQSRAITSLFPTPAGMPAEPLKVLFSFAAVQGMMDPLTPIGQYSLKVIFAASAGLFHVKATPETQTALYSAGERLWVNITALMRNSVGRRIFHNALSFIEPTIQQALSQILEDPRLQPEKAGIRFNTLRRIAPFFLSLAGNVIQNQINPGPRREMIVGRGEQFIVEARSLMAGIQGDRYQRLLRIADLMPELAEQWLRRMLTLYISGVVTGIMSYNFLYQLAEKIPAESPALNGQSTSDLVMETTRGLPHNVTTEMDLDLWIAAQAIRQDPAAIQEFNQHTSAELARRYLSGEMPAVLEQIVANFLDRYGGRGLAEIDMGRSRWQEDPTHVFEALVSYLKIDRPEQAPDAVFERGKATAEAAGNRMIAALRGTRFGWIKARAAKFFLRRVRQWMGIRESPKFFAVRMMGLVRSGLLRTGQEFVQAGELARADDLMFLTLPEIHAFACRERRDWKGIIELRREAYRRELLRRQVPRLLLSDGRAFYEGISTQSASGGELTGSPVSPGSIEGLVRVVFDPRQANLQPGEIMVCPGTDPSWTPLFLTAGGLVMETGGMMTHGAVVAREYGIPAVVGVNQATLRLKTGQRIYLNGSTGQITLLETATESEKAP